jgi:hypothetical protein
LNAFQNIKMIESKLADSHLTETVHSKPRTFLNFSSFCQIFSTNGHLSDQFLDNARGAVALEFQSLIQNILSVKSHDPLVRANPDIHYNLTNLVGRRSWIAHEYGTSAPIQWNAIASSIYHDIPRIKQAIITAIGASYLEV